MRDSVTTLVPGIENISNFRDAGLQGMKKGRLFRSATLDQATISDVQIVKKGLGIKTIVDLRGPKESLKNTTLHSEYYDHKSILKINLAHSMRDAVWESVSFLVKIWFLILNLLGYTLYAQRYIISHSFLANEGLYGLNKAFLKYGGAYLKEFLDLASDKDSFPLLVHCSAGKDRTGLTIAILQKLCCVDSGLIVEEYSKSADLLDQILLQKNVGKFGLSPDFSLSPPETMIKTLAHIEDHYGGVRSYCLSIGCTNAQLDRIVQNLCQV